MRGRVHRGLAALLLLVLATAVLVATPPPMDVGSAAEHAESP
jgi:hypothetical protein